jgi:hypothetical protein
LRYKDIMQRRRLLYVILGLSLFGGLYTVALDFDHLWTWILGTLPPVIFPGAISTAGRPFHTWYIFLGYALVNAAWITALVRRYLQPHMDMEMTQ